METTTATATQLTGEERRAHNRAVHREQRMAAFAARGPAGIASAWVDEARAVARQWQTARAGTDGADDAWNDLAATLSNFVQRYGR
ncbi:hypothetical protein AB0O57_32500 [Streptomyces sp. NPDC091201]|uniref:hypothetical protein n=1 Tax=Streptomyces sp. NPDC091201 TaxID=3155190 RepID=UPI003441BD6C